MTCTTSQLAQILDAELRGSSEITLDDAQPLDFAEVNHLSFLAEEKNIKTLGKSQAGAVLIPRDLVEAALAFENEHRAFLVVDDALDSFVEAIRYFRPQRELPDTGVSDLALVADSASIGAGTHIYPQAVVGEEVVIGENCRIMSGAVIGDGCQLGNDVTIYPNAVLYHDVQIEDRVIIHANAVIGADGFGYRLQEGRHVRVPQLGTVRIENDVEIGACSTVDRAMAGETIIGEGTKIDNLVMVGHNCQIGKHNIYASQVGFAGSSTTGDYVVCGGQVGVGDHVRLGDRAVFGAKSGVPSDRKGGRTYLGMPAEPIETAVKSFTIFSKLPQMRQQLRALSREFNALKAELNQQTTDESTKESTKESEAA